MWASAKHTEYGMRRNNASKLIMIGSDNGLSPGRHQAIIWTNAAILLIWTLGTNVSETLSEIHTFSFKKMHLIMFSAKWRPYYLGRLNVSSTRTGHVYSLSVLLVLRPEYFGIITTIACLPMTWLHASPGHQQPWHWLCKIGDSLSPAIFPVSMRNDSKCKNMGIFYKIHSSRKELR